MLKRILLELARGPAGEFLVGNACAHLPFLLAMLTVHADRQVLVIKHPVPTWEVHLLAVPKRKVRSFMELDLSDPANRELARSLIHSLITAAARLNLHDYTLILNGGRYQEVAQLHLHLANARLELPGALYDAESLPPGTNDGYAHNITASTFYHLLTPPIPWRSLAKLDLSQPDQVAALLDLLYQAQQIIHKHALDAYRLVIPAQSGLRIHLTG
jgi:diadenosine tetraphosphate (Ap4A) HIT family hydrolase